METASSPLIFDTGRMSAHDGPGMRTVLFFKGCPLRCRWCHNPESFRTSQEVWIFPDSCIRCGQCVEACPSESLVFGTGGLLQIDRERCTGCGICASVCPSRSIRAVGRSYDISELMKVILREKAFMDETGGGVTLSGGEVLLYPEYAATILRLCREEGIHTAVDTSGAVPWTHLEMVLPYTDLFLYDIKLRDSERHRALTGQGNERILENLIRLSEALEGSDRKIWIRTPLIPGDTDDVSNIEGIAGFFKGCLPQLPGRWELCCFNPLGEQKYKRLELPWGYSSDLMCRSEDVDVLKQAAAAVLREPEILHVSGLTAH